MEPDAPVGVDPLSIFTYPDPPIDEDDIAVDNDILEELLNDDMASEPIPEEIDTDPPSLAPSPASTDIVDADPNPLCSNMSPADVPPNNDSPVLIDIDLEDPPIKMEPVDPESADPPSIRGFFETSAVDSSLSPLLTDISPPADPNASFSASPLERVTDPPSPADIPPKTDTDPSNNEKDEEVSIPLLSPPKIATPAADMLVFDSEVVKGELRIDIEPPFPLDPLSSTMSPPAATFSCIPNFASLPRINRLPGGPKIPRVSGSNRPDSKDMSPA